VRAIDKEQLRAFGVSVMGSNPATVFAGTYAAIEGLALINGASSLAAAR
jgi:hypothetical protein